MKKKIFCTVLFIYTMMFFPITALASEIINQGTCGDNITWMLDADGLLTVSGKGNMDIWNSETDVPWYDQMNMIKSVIIQDGVTDVGNYAFYYCDNLESVYIGNDVLKIGKYSFFECYKLTSVQLPDSVTTIEDGAFMACGFERITLPEQLTAIGEAAFYDCFALKSITIPPNVTYIGDYAFRKCDSLADIWFTGDAPELGYDPFPMNLNYRYYPRGNETWYSIDYVHTGGGFWKDYCLTHDYEEWTFDESYNCEVGGVGTRDCVYNDSTETQYFEKMEHTAVIDKAIEATCTEQGKTEGKHCSVCNAVLVVQTDIPAKGHSWNGVVTIQPAEGKTGVKTYTCVLCKGSKTEELPALKHEHKYTNVVTAPTCTEKGFTTHTCVCGDMYKDCEIPAKGHTEVIDKAVEATCTTFGKTEGKHCSVCNSVLVTQFTKSDSNGHEWKISKDSLGNNVYLCSNCEYFVAVPTINIDSLNDVYNVYALESWENGFISVPDEYPMCLSFVSDESENFSVKVLSGTCISLANSATIVPKYTTWYNYCTNGINFSITYEMPGIEYISKRNEPEFGSSTLRITTDKWSKDIIINVIDYGESYADKVIDDYISEHISDDMSLTEKLDKICQMPAYYYEYSVDYQSAKDMIVSGGGDCWASSNLMLELCNRLGLQAKIRPAFNDPYAAGGGHRNVMVTISDGDYYILDSGTAEPIPRWYVMYRRSSLFAYRILDNGCIEVYQYDGEISENERIVIPETIDSFTVTSVSDSFLSNGELTYSSISEIVLPDTVKKIGNRAFADCSALTKINIPESLEELGDMPFVDCDNLVEFVCGSENKNFSVKDGVLYNKDFTELIYAPGVSSVEIPDTVERIGDYAFYCNDNITEIIARNVKEIGEGALGNCSNLKKVVFDNIQNIGFCALAENNDLNVYFEGDAPQFDAYSFYSSSVNVFCDMSNTTWTENVFKNYEGAVSWNNRCSDGKHTYVHAVINPSCTQNGYTTHTCSACKDSYVDTYVDAKGHTEVVDKALEATCTEKGKTEGKHCSVCNAVIVAQTDIPAKSHTEILINIKEATEKEEGYTGDRVCSVCGEVLEKGGVIPSKNEHPEHSYGDWTVVKEATCDTDGEQRRYCTDCAYYESETINAKVHSWDNGTITLEPTADKAGVKTFTCSVCKETKAENIPALNHEHKYTSVVTEPTCTEKGFTTHTCACGDTYKDNEVPAKGHMEKLVNLVEATATTNGYTGDIVCSVCNTTIKKGETIPATGEPITIGDVDGDCEITAKDATQILRHINGKASVLTVEGADTVLLERIADVDGDGDVTAKDATQILRHINGKASVLDKQNK